MAPLLPSESTVYTLTLPDDIPDDDRYLLKVRTGAATTSNNANIIVHGGFTVGMSLSKVCVSEIEKQLFESGHMNKDWDRLLTSEIFYLDVIQRKWIRVDLNVNQVKPEPRAYHSIIFFNNTLYIYGGLIFNQHLRSFVPTNDLWQFSLETKEWICLDDGTTSGMVARFDHTILAVDYVSPKDDQIYPSISIVGGRGELNQELNHVVLFDLHSKSFVSNPDMRLSLNELKPLRGNSDSSNIDPKSAVDPDDSRLKLKCLKEHHFIITGQSNVENEGNDDTFVLYSPRNPDELEEEDQEFLDSGASLDPSKHPQQRKMYNPLVTIPVVPGAAGLRVPLSHTDFMNPNVVPNNLRNPSGAVFGSTVIVSGYNTLEYEFQVFLFNRPSQKWTRLNIDAVKRARELHLWKSFLWPAHHKVLVLGSNLPLVDSFNTIQRFDMLIAISLPIINIFHAFEVSEDAKNSRVGSSGTKYASIKENTSFEAYAKYVAPTTKISSIRSIFPNYAVTLGRNAFERYGSYLADFEFVTADGDKVNVPLMLLRKRWGRCFDMLLAKGYARAVYHLENQHDDDETDSSELQSCATGKKSLCLISKATAMSPSLSNISRDDNIPQFRLPFQDSSSSNNGTGTKSSPQLTPFTPPLTGSAGPTSRKPSVISTGNLSMTTTSTSDIPEGATNSIVIDFDDIPQQPAEPNEPLPPLEPISVQLNEKFAPLKTVASRDHLRESPRNSPRNSPRGSVSGASISPGLNPGLNSLTNLLGGAAAAGSAAHSSIIKLKDLRSANVPRKKSGPSRSSSIQASEEASINDTNSNIDSFAREDFSIGGEGVAEEQTESRVLLEPLLIPRSLYLPFSTSTVEALAEFFFTGQLGNKWLIYPTTTDTFLVAKFYELPLLYDLIAEALYAIIGKKESALIKRYAKFLKEYHGKLKDVHKDDEDDDVKIEQYFESHPHVHKAFAEIEKYLSAVDDGYLNLSLLRRSSKSSVYSSGASSAANSDNGTRNHSKSSGRFGKSRLSKEVNLDDDDDDGVEADEDYYSDSNDVDAADEEQSKASKTEKGPELKSAAASGTQKLSQDDPKYIDTESTNFTFFKNPSGSSSNNYEDDIGPKEISKSSNDSSVLDDDDPLSVSGVSTNNAVTDSQNESVLPVHEASVTSSKPRSTSEGEGIIQVPEGRFKLSREKRDEMNKMDGSGSEEIDARESTSDSENMAFGLGLVGDLNIKIHEDDCSDKAQDHHNGDDKCISPTALAGAAAASGDAHDRSAPTLENLASTDSPPPSDHLLQIIYETAALACDMKLLLRTINVLDLSKLFNCKREELLRELNSYGLKYEEEKLKERLFKQEQEQKQREKERKEMEFAMAPVQEPITAVQSQPMVNRAKSEFPQKRDLGKEYSPEPMQRRATGVTVIDELKVEPKASTESEVYDDSDARSTNSIKMRKFPSLRSLSSLNLTTFSNRKTSTATLFDQQTTNDTGRVPPQFIDNPNIESDIPSRSRNPFRNKKSGKLFSIISKRTAK